MNTILSTFTLIILAFSCKGFQTKKQNSETETVYYFIRHAEKELSGNNPNLTEEGIARTKRWVQYFSDKNIDYVYSTSLNRTQQTAIPIAESQQLSVIDYDPNQLLDKDFLTKTKGKSTIIVGHSNTNPDLVNTLIKKQKYSDIEESEYGIVITVKLKDEQFTDTKTVIE